MADRAALEAEKDTLVKEMAAMQKQFMGELFDGEFNAEKYYSSADMKAFKSLYNEKAMRVSAIASQLIKL